ncbi:MFS transporter [Mycetocola sp. 2940]|uniref:MFS transporter n=1 Tax=Mycetocola sp. 2940 TaxID=3156452 RepID=UPI0033960204
MTASANRPLLAGRLLAFVGILLVAANLRTAVAALSPILSRVSAEVPLSPLIIGLLGALPPICFAVFGIFTPMLVRRSRLEIVVVISLVAIVLGHVLRGAAGNVAVLVLGSIVAFGGIGVGNVLLPPLVKKYFPDRIGIVTALYVTTLSVSTFLPPLIAVPVADAAGWRVSLMMWAAVGVLAMIPWTSLLLRQPSPDRASVEEARPEVVRNLRRSPLAWALVVIFGLSAVHVYAMFAWLPVLLQDLAGVDDATAGTLLALFAFMGFPAGLLIPVLAARMKNVAILVYAAVAFFVAGYLGLLLAPAAAPALWVALAGLGPMLFPLSLVLINLRTRTGNAAIALSGFVQSLGYVLGAAGPLAVGMLYTATGSWTAPLVLLILLALGCVGAGAVVGRRRMLEDGA